MSNDEAMLFGVLIMALVVFAVWLAHKDWVTYLLL